MASWPIWVGGSLEINPWIYFSIYCWKCPSDEKSNDFRSLRFVNLTLMIFSFVMYGKMHIGPIELSGDENDCGM